MPVTPVRACHRIITCTVLLFLLLVGTPAARASAPCTDSTGTPYSIRICITAPADGAVLTGDTTITATTAPVSGTSPGVQRMVFWLDGSYLLTDYSPPYTFTLPTSKFVDGPRVLSVSALMRDGTTTAPQASINLTFATGTTDPAGEPEHVRAQGRQPAARDSRWSSAPSATAPAASRTRPSSRASSRVGTRTCSSTSATSTRRARPTEFANWYGPSGAPTRSSAASSRSPTRRSATTSTTAPGARLLRLLGQRPALLQLRRRRLALHQPRLELRRSGSCRPTTAQYQWLSSDLAANTPAVHARLLPPPAVQHRRRRARPPRCRAIWSLLAQHGVDLVAQRPRPHLPALAAARRQREPDARPA